MTLFQMLSVAVLVVAVISYYKTVRRYYYETVLFETTGSIPHPRLEAASLWFRFTVIVEGCVLAPLLARKYRKQHEEQVLRDEQRRMIEESRAARVAYELATKCEESREAWLQNNPVTLYYNTVDGITVVTTPRMYAHMQLATAWYRRNAMWDKTVLMPDPAVHLFVDKKGFENVAKNYPTKPADPVTCGQVSGWLTTLDELVARYRISMEQKLDLFVPCVNESVLPFSEHVITTRARGKYVEDLVRNQAPLELIN